MDALHYERSQTVDLGEDKIIQVEMIAYDIDNGNPISQFDGRRAVLRCAKDIMAEYEVE